MKVTSLSLHGARIFSRPQSLAASTNGWRRLNKTMSGFPYEMDTKSTYCGLLLPVLCFLSLMIFLINDFGCLIPQLFQYLDKQSIH